MAQPEAQPKGLRQRTDNIAKNDEHILKYIINHN